MCDAVLPWRARAWDRPLGHIATNPVEMGHHRSNLCHLPSTLPQPVAASLPSNNIREETNRSSRKSPSGTPTQKKTTHKNNPDLRLEEDKQEERAIHA